MSTTATLKLDVRQLPPDGPPVDDALLGRIARGDAPSGYPLLDPSHVELPSDPPGLDRAKLAEAIARSNAELGNQLEARTVDAIRTDARFIIAGQQPCLLTGPSYVLLKAITAIQLARDLASKVGAPLIPGFWIATEDHDLAEVSQCTINGHTFRCDHEELRNGGALPPVGSISLRPWRDDLLRFAERMLPPSSARDETMDILAMADFTDYSTMFGSLLSAVLGPGRVVLIDPMRIRELLSPALADVIEHAGELEAALQRGAKMLTDAGVQPPMDRVNLFQFVDGRRARAELSTSIAAQIRQHPQQYSPGAALRPIVQDAALPVLCTVCGPAEMKYLWQIDPLYQAAGVQRSHLRPRLSATILSDKDVQRAERFGLKGDAIFKVAEILEGYDANRAGMDDADVSHIEQLRDRLIQHIRKLNGHAEEWMMHKAMRSINHQVDKLGRRIRERRLSQQGVGKDLLTQLANVVMPLGRPQERVMCGLELIGRFGTGLVEQLTRQLNPVTTAHHLITVTH